MLPGTIVQMAQVAFDHSARNFARLGQLRRGRIAQRSELLAAMAALCERLAVRQLTETRPLRPGDTNRRCGSRFSAKVLRQRIPNLVEVYKFVRSADR